MIDQSPKFFSLVMGIYFLFSIPICTPSLGVKKKSIKDLQLPTGFEIEYWAKEVPNARSMCHGPDGIIYIGSRGKGQVYALKYDPKTMEVDTVHTILKGLNMPNGVAYREGSLFVAEVDKIWQFPVGELFPSKMPEGEVIFDKYPSETHHGWKYIAFGPDGLLYIPVGAPCNICHNPQEKVYASMTTLNTTTSEMKIYAEGIRNSVGFDWDPKSGKLWFSDNGRDWLGDDSPEDELNYCPEEGIHFGYPFCHAGHVSDPEFGHLGECSTYTAPSMRLGAHVAALGIMFYEGNMFPEDYQNKIFIAEHGSWNRSQPAGYQISTVDYENGKSSNYVPFIEGWLKDGKAWGRPVAFLEMKDGSVLISDDHSGSIYRVTYEK